MAYFWVQSRAEIASHTRKVVDPAIFEQKAGREPIGVARGGVEREKKRKPSKSIMHRWKAGKVNLRGRKNKKDRKECAWGVSYQ